MKQFECVIATAGKPNEEQMVVVEAVNLREALVVNSQLRPDTYVKEIKEITQ